MKTACYQRYKRNFSIPSPKSKKGVNVMVYVSAMKQAAGTRAVTAHYVCRRLRLTR